jgi:transposase
MSSHTYKKIINKFLNICKSKDVQLGKLGGLGVLVEVDETALNHKIKAHRRRAPRNKTDALCIVEVDDVITRAYSCVIPNKKADTMLPIILENVALVSKVWTDGHLSYGKLSQFGYDHATVCHKREFVNYETGVNTQAVESFNNEVNLEIKRRKCLKTRISG